MAGVQQLGRFVYPDGFRSRDALEYLKKSLETSGTVFELSRKISEYLDVACRQVCGECAETGVEACVHTGIMVADVWICL